MGLAATLLACDSGPDEIEAAPTPDRATRSAEADPKPIPGHPVLSPNAKVETFEMLRASAANRASEADRGGRMWLERLWQPNAEGDFEEVWRRGEAGATAPPPLPVGSTARFELVFEVGPLGIDEGGVLFLAAEPFWEWSDAQTRAPDLAGYATAKPRQPGVRLEPDGFSGRFDVSGRALVAGEKIDLVYGAGALGARVDRYAERDAEILLATDADGDRVRGWLEDVPRLEIVAEKGSQLVAFGPAEVAPGAAFTVSVALLDAEGNPAPWPVGAEVGLAPVEGPSVPTTDDGALAPTASTPEAPGSKSPIRLEALAPEKAATLRYRVTGAGPVKNLASLVNPIVVRRGTTMLRWADLHGHSQVSDGTGRPADYFVYARDIARLDAAALTDHDHWGIRPLDQDPEKAEAILQTAIEHHAPNEFVTLPGYEWTSWLHGHRHVLYFDEEAPLFSSLAEATDRPDELWNALRGRPALTFAHHSAGEPIATNWWFRPDPELEPVVEIVSVHGSSEAADAPASVEGGIPGAFIRDILERGAHLGFIGSGDSHDGHPGLAQLAGGPGHGGLAGIFSERLDRESLLQALRERRTFATNGIRPWFFVELDDVPMGGRIPVVPSENAPEQTLRIRYEGTAPIERIDLVRSGIIASIPGDGRIRLDWVRKIPALGPNEFHYVRIVQADQGAAWSSPIFADDAADAAAETP